MPVGSNDRLAELYGTTLKGNDINFRIFSPNAQKELNAVMPPQLNGAWGAGLTPFFRSGGSGSRPVARGCGQGDWSDHVEQ
ncbi:hypothetical protein, partial [Kocuria sp. ICS0012]|uniref:hypothetical protein n=1 Tax=Kocuria sp. ICS0012 TaxID=1834155 RepID=UPI000A6905C1